MSKIGLIAGEGVFPLLFAKAASDSGAEVIACAVTGAASKDIESVAAKTYWVKLGTIGKMIKYFKDEGVTDVSMCGRIRKEIFFKNPAIDVVGLKLLARLKDKRTVSILSAAADFLEDQGLNVKPSTKFLDGLLPDPGVLTKKKPTKAQIKDIEFGSKMAKSLADLDIGQMVVVKDRIVVAAEAVEGTNDCILRGGKISGPGAVVVKMNSRRMDDRFDVPTVGVMTIEKMKEVGAAVLAVESGATLLLERDELIALADSSKIAVVSIDSKSGHMS